MFKSLNEYLGNFSNIISGTTISIVLAIAQLFSYNHKISYYSYFNVSYKFIELNILQDLNSLVIYLIIFLLFIGELVLFYFLYDTILKNKHNLKNKITILGVILALIVALLIISLFNSYLDYLLTGKFIYNFSISILVNVFAILMLIGINYIKKFKYEMKNNQDIYSKKIDICIMFIISMFAIVCLISIIQNNAKEEAAQKRDFYILENNNIVLYLINDMAITAKYELKSDNTIIIDTTELTKINTDNIKFIEGHFNEVIIK